MSTDNKDRVADVLDYSLTRGEFAEENVVDAIQSVARALRDLGNADASTPMGGLEALGKVMGEGMESMALAISDLADAVRSSKE